MDDRFYSWVDKKFQPYPSSKRIWELKAEMIETLNNKYADYISQGYGSEEAFKLSIQGVGDINDNEIGGNENLQKKAEETSRAWDIDNRHKKNKSLARTVKNNYWLIIALIYFFVSSFFDSWSYSWTIFIAARIFQGYIIETIETGANKDNKIIDYRNKSGNND